MAAMIILFFEAPWVSLKAEGTILATITLSRDFESTISAGESNSGSPGWAITLSVLLVLVAIQVWRSPTALGVVGSSALGGVAVIVAALFTWLGRSVWLNTAALADGLSLHMGWGYYVTLVLAVVLIVMPWFLIPDSEWPED